MSAVVVAAMAAVGYAAALWVGWWLHEHNDNDN